MTNTTYNLDSIIVTPEEVRDTIKSLPTGKAAGPDPLNNRLLKELTQPLALPLSDLFNFSLSSGSVPHIWKQANVTPINKKNDPSDVSNYSDIIKTFDRVWHKGLLFKLKSAGVFGSLLTWFSYYLTDRKQRVVLHGVNSSWTSVKAGVPQGSILGPLLFLLYINDIVVDINSSIRLIADDTNLYIIVDIPIQAAEQLNLDLAKIHRWAENESVSSSLGNIINHITLQFC